MAALNETPSGSRVRIAFFGLRNAGKSTLVNDFTGQQLAIVSEVPGTTTDPVSKAMEILPLGPCLITDTAGLDDVGELGAMRVKKTLDVLATTDVAVWVDGGAVAESRSGGAVAESRSGGAVAESRSGGAVAESRSGGAVAESRSGGALAADIENEFRAQCDLHKVLVLTYRRGDSVEELKRRIAELKLADTTPPLLAGLVKRGDRVVCVVPIDESAPKGRLILPQQQAIRECLDLGAVCTVCQPEAAEAMSESDRNRFELAITDSQAFGRVRGLFRRLTSFSILFARQKGDLGEYVRGLKAIASLRDGDRVLVAEGCTHHRQCNDIGSVKIPKALKKLSGRELDFEFASGNDFSADGKYALIVQCGGCMLTRREVLRRIALAREAGVPIVNYGMVLAMAGGLRIEDVLV